MPDGYELKDDLCAPTQTHETVEKQHVECFTEGLKECNSNSISVCENGKQKIEKTCSSDEYCQTGECVPLPKNQIEQTIKTETSTPTVVKHFNGRPISEYQKENPIFTFLKFFIPFLSPMAFSSIPSATGSCDPESLTISNEMTNMEDLTNTGSYPGFLGPIIIGDDLGYFDFVTFYAKVEGNFLECKISEKVKGTFQFDANVSGINHFVIYRGTNNAGQKLFKEKFTYGLIGDFLHSKVNVVSSYKDIIDIVINAATKQGNQKSCPFEGTIYCDNDNIVSENNINKGVQIVNTENGASTINWKEKANEYYVIGQSIISGVWKRFFTDVIYDLLSESGLPKNAVSTINDERITTISGTTRYCWVKWRIHEERRISDWVNWMVKGTPELEVVDSGCENY